MAANGCSSLSDESTCSELSTIPAEKASVQSTDSDDSSNGVRCACSHSVFYKFGLKQLGVMRRMTTLGGYYWQLGIGKCLERCYKNSASPRTLSLDISIHQIELNGKQIFPIIGTIIWQQQCAPFLIGMQEYTNTNSSYNANDLLKDFVLEVQKLTKNGWPWNKGLVPFRIRRITCDLGVIGAVRGVAPFNTPFGCGVCNVVARMERVLETRSFPVEFHHQYTNQELRSKQNARPIIYHFAQRYFFIDCQPSPLLQLTSVDMIADIVPNPRQLLYTGAMKLLLTSWSGHQRQHFKGVPWSDEEMDHIDQQTGHILIPYELYRRQSVPPSVADLLTATKWQEYDYGMMLHYYGLVVFKDHLSTELYEHFLHLYCAVTICSSEQYRNHIPTARYCFEAFMRGCETHYSIIPNFVHSLRHLVDAIDRFGPLRPLSSEDRHDRLLDFLRHRMLHPEGDSVSKLLIKCVKRFNNYDRPLGKPLPRAANGEPLIQVRNNCHLQAESFEDRWFMTRDKSIVKLENATDIELIGRELCGSLPFFTAPMHSSIIDVYTADSLEPTYGPIMRYDFGDVFCKLMVMVSDNKFLFVPILCTMLIEH